MKQFDECLVSYWLGKFLNGKRVDELLVFEKL